MPNVDGKKFPYTKEGKSAARAYARKNMKSKQYQKKAAELKKDKG